MSSKKPPYTPGYDEAAIEKESSRLGPSGRSPKACLSIEEAAQRAVAQNPEWLLARRTNLRGDDTRASLEDLGFKVNGEADDLFYRVTPPDGWTKTTEGYWTTVWDATGKERISQFFKGAFYDRSAFLNI